jgi:Protein of unknown function (DUF5818)
MRISIAVFLLVSACLFAQEVPLGGRVRDPNPHAARSQTYQGCVIRTNGQVMLTDASGTDYKLVSSTRALDRYVGQEVQITATPINPNDSTADEISVMAQVPMEIPPTLDVEEIAKVADHCTSPK